MKGGSRKADLRALFRSSNSDQIQRANLRGEGRAFRREPRLSSQGTAHCSSFS